MILHSSKSVKSVRPDQTGPSDKKEQSNLDLYFC